MNSLLDGSAGKVIVIDEAYVLAQSSFGREVLDTLVERVQEGANFVVLLLGYEDKLREMLRTCNPGLERRFRLESAFIFDDFDDDILIEIMLAMAMKRELSLAPKVWIFLFLNPLCVQCRASFVFMFRQRVNISIYAPRLFIIFFFCIIHSQRVIDCTLNLSKLDHD